MATESSPQSTMAILTATSFVAVVFFVLIAKKFYFFFFKKKRFFIFPRFGIRSINNISMVISITVSVVLLLVLITGGVAGFFFRAYPGSRVTFEIILVKMSGLLFGPTVGMISGALIDLFSFSFSAGVFHYGYFISVSLMGLLAGMFRSIDSFSNGKLLNINIFGTIYMFFVTLITWLMFYKFSGLAKEGIDVALAGIAHIHLPFILFIAVIGGFSAFCVLIVWTLVLVLKIKNRNKNQEKFPAWSKWLIVSIFASASTILVVFITLLPVFDSQIDKQPYQLWLAIRMVLSIPLMIVDVSVIFPILALVNSFVKRDDCVEKERFANLGEPLFFRNWDTSVSLADLKANKEKFAELLNCLPTVKYELNTRQIRALKREFSSILEGFKIIDGLNTKDVSSMDFPVENCQNYDENRLREDRLVSSNEVLIHEVLSGVKYQKKYEGSLFVLVTFASNSAS